MPTSARAGYVGFTKGFGKFGTALRVDVGIDPYIEVGGAGRIRIGLSLFAAACCSTSQALRASSPFRGAMGAGVHLFSSSFVRYSI